MESEPLFLYGDFNFRLDFAAVVKVALQCTLVCRLLYYVLNITDVHIHVCTGILCIVVYRYTFTVYTYMYMYMYMYVLMHSGGGYKFFAVPLYLECTVVVPL